MIALVALAFLIAGALLGLVAFATALCVLVTQLRIDSNVHAKNAWALAMRELQLEMAEKRLAQEEAERLKLEQERVAKAIESNSLPWIPKTDQMQAQYEQEAIDKMQNPSFYADVVDGLGR